MGQLWLVAISLRYPKNGLLHLYKWYCKELKSIYHYLFDKITLKIDFFSLINYRKSYIFITWHLKVKIYYREYHMGNICCFNISCLHLLPLLSGYVNCHIASIPTLKDLF